MTRLLLLLKPYQMTVLFAAFLGFCTVSGNVGLMATSAYLISTAALHPELQALSIAIVGVRFFGIARAVFRYFERYVSHDVTFRLLKTLRVWIYGALEPLAPARLLRFRSGDLLSRIVADVETLKFLYLKVVAPVLIALLTALAMTILLLSLYPAVLVPIVWLGYLILGLGLPYLLLRLQHKTGKDVLVNRAKVNAALVDTLQGLTELRTYDRTAYQQEKIGTLAAELHVSQGRVATTTAWSEAMTVLVSQLTMVAALAVAIPWVSSGLLSGVHLAVIALAIQSSFEAFLPLPMLVHYWQESKAAGRRLFELIDDKPAVDEEKGGLAVTGSMAEIHISNLTFSYLPNQPILKNFNLHLKAGEKVALIGPSGIGKSTLVDLLLRFFEYDTGSIRLNGCELKEYDVFQLRQAIGLVAQRTHLFNTSIRHNLRIANENCTEEDLWQSLEQVQLKEFVQSLPEGLDTPVGQNGLAFSGGQRQRIALARILLEQPKLFIFDEATVGLDAVTEQQVLDSLTSVMAGRTVLYITHRLTGLEKFDRIAVMQNGQIAEIGSQTELLSRPSLYAHLWRLQMGNIE